LSWLRSCRAIDGLTGPRAPIDSARRPRLIAGVSPLGRIAAILLLSLWLPATLHCAVEAAGLHGWPGCHNESLHDPAHHQADACHPLEGTEYKPETAPLKVQPPPLGWLAVSLFASPLAPPKTEPSRTLPPPREPESVATWRFVERAAPPARAPSAV
jgi:hypothetical protein